MSNKERNAVAGCLVWFLSGLLCCGFLFWFSYGTRDEVTTKVVHKEHIAPYGTFRSSTYYLIYTQDEVFKLEDSWCYLQFRSSDLYGHLETGKTYKFTVYGIRVPVLSTYRVVTAIR